MDHRTTDAREDALQIVCRLRDAGHVALFAGGCVRDELLGLTPKDYDVATDALPDRVLDIFGRRRTKEVGAAFGVVLVKEGASQIEVATFRSDGSYVDGRRPESVVFTNAADDAKRRDFTINGLFYDPLAGDGDDGIIDHVGGRRDLKARRLRCIGDPLRRFAEDYLRLLRAVRFAARFDLVIGDETWGALRDGAYQISHVTNERVGEEVRRMLVPATRGRAWQLLWESGLIGPIFRGLPEPPTDTSPHRPITRHVAAVRGEVTPTLAVAATLLDLATGGGATAGEALSRQAVEHLTRVGRDSLRLSNAETAALHATLNLWPLVLDAPPSVALLRRFLAVPQSGDARQILRALRHDRSLGPRINDVLGRLDDLAGSHGETAPEPWVRGDDLMRAGLAPGPAFSVAIDAAYDAQLDGTAIDRDEAVAIALDAAVRRR